MLARSPEDRPLNGAAAVGRRAEARLRFAVGGGRTSLARQHVPYPAHVTRPFFLDGARPDLATLYLQSASGGFYRGDDVTLTVEVGPGAAVHLTTQAATVVHDCRGEGCRQSVTIDVSAGGFCAYTPDPLVMFPGAALASVVDLTLGAGATAILADGVCRHDPAGGGAAFDRYDATTTIRDATGTVLVADRGGIRGEDLSGSSSPLGRWNAFGTCLILAPAAQLPAAADVEEAVDAHGCLAGAGAAPNGAGVAVRLLAADGGALARGLAAMFAVAFEAIHGGPPAPRRK